MPPVKTFAENQTSATLTQVPHQPQQTPALEGNPGRQSMVQRSASGAPPPGANTPPLAQAARTLSTAGSGAVGRASAARAMQNSAGNLRVARMLLPQADKPIQRETSQSQRSEAQGELPRSINDALNSSDGHPLPASAQDRMEQRFSTDFSGVKVHTGVLAAQAATDINATAFTHGQNIYFNHGKFQPGTAEGDKLLAHELTHTVQQASHIQAKTDGRITLSEPDDREEHEAETIARQVTQGEDRDPKPRMAVHTGRIFRENGAGGAAGSGGTRPTLDSYIRETPPGFTDPQLDRAYQSYYRTEPNPADPRTWALRVTTGAPRRRLERLLGPDYARGQRSAAPRPPVDVTQVTRPQGYTDPRQSQDVQTLGQHPQALLNRLDDMLQTPIEGGAISRGHYDILQGNVAEVLARPMLQSTLEEVRVTQPDAQLFLGVRARLYGLNDPPSGLVQFSDGLIASIRGNLLYIHRVVEIKSGQEGGVEAQEQIHRWIEAHSTVGFEIVLPGRDQVFEYSDRQRQVIDFTRAPRLAIVPRGARFAGEQSGHQVAAPLIRRELPQSPEEIQYITRLVAQAIIQFQQAIRLQQQAAQNLLRPAHLSSLAELQSPTVVRQLQAANSGLALVDGRLYRASISGTAIQVRLLMPTPIAVPRLPAESAGQSAAPGLPATGAGRPGGTQQPRLPAGSPATSAGDAAGPGSRPALPAATSGGPTNALPAGNAAGGPTIVPFSLPNRGVIPPNILNFTEQDILIAGQRIGPSATGQPQVGELIIVGFDNYWIVSNVSTRQPVAGVFEGGRWYVVVTGGRVLPIDASGRIRTDVEPIPFEHLPSVAQRQQSTGGGVDGRGATPGQRIVGGGLGIIMLANEILGPISRVLAQQRRNIAMGEAAINFWIRFGGNPERGVWDWGENRRLPPDAALATSVFGAETVPYVISIDVEALHRNLPQLIQNYQEFLLFLDLAKTIGTIAEQPPMPRSPSPEQRQEHRRYIAIVGWPDRANLQRYDITDVIEQLRNRTLGQLDQSMRTQLQALPPAEQNNIFRLKSGSETRLFRSASGGQPILSSREILGPNPWVRPLGRRIEGGVWNWFRHGHSEERVLVVPANADAQRSALVSVYPVKQPIGDTLDEVQAGGRPILSRTPSEGTPDSFVAGPEPGLSSRFGETRYYRHPEFPNQWTAAIGELRQFWVNASELEPVLRQDVQSYLRGSPDSGRTP